jgi:hypothetical protein
MDYWCLTDRKGAIQVRCIQFCLSIISGTHSLKHQLINYRLLNPPANDWNYVKLIERADKYYIRQAADIALGIYTLPSFFPMYVVACTLSHGNIYTSKRPKVVESAAWVLSKQSFSWASSATYYLRYILYLWFWAYHHGVNWQYLTLAIS